MRPDPFVPSPSARNFYPEYSGKSVPDATETGPVEGVSKIAVLKTGNLGDFIVTLPALNALKSAYPTAVITLLGMSWHIEFLKDRPSPVGRVVPVPAVMNVSISPGDEPDSDGVIDRFTSKMNSERFDIAIQFCDNGLASNPFIKTLGADLTVGFRGGNTEPADRGIPFTYRQSEVRRFLELTRVVGADPTVSEPKLTVTDADRREATGVLEGLHRRFVVMHTGASDFRKTWTPENFARVADRLSDEGFYIVFTGTESDGNAAVKTIGYMKNTGKVINASLKLTLSGLAGLLSLSSLTVSNDTGPLHLARAVGAKTVGIYWLPSLTNWGPATHANHRTAISYQLTCPGCGIIPADPWPFEPVTPDCNHQYRFVEGIDADEVTELAMQLLR